MPKKPKAHDPSQLSLFDPPPKRSILSNPSPSAQERFSKPVPEDKPPKETEANAPSSTESVTAQVPFQPLPEDETPRSGLARENENEEAEEPTSQPKSTRRVVAISAMEEDTAHLENILQEQTGKRWSVTFHQNRRTMISFNRSKLTLRLHQRFLEAPDSVLRAIGDKLSANVDAWPAVVGTFINEFIEDDPPPPRSAPDPDALVTKGQMVDLRLMFQRLNERYFDGQLTCLVTWGQVGTPKVFSRTKRLILGSFQHERNIIRIHPVLDHKRVPSEVVEGILFHEMCHALVGDEGQGSRRVLHGPAFRKNLQRNPHTESSDTWIREHMDWLLRRRRALAGGGTI